MTLHETYIDWLIPNGFTETFQSEKTVHFIKDQTRIICYLHIASGFVSKDILSSDIPVSLRSGEYYAPSAELLATHDIIKNAAVSYQ